MTGITLTAWDGSSPGAAARIVNDSAPSLGARLVQVLRRAGLAEPTMLGVQGTAMPATARVPGWRRRPSGPCCPYWTGPAWLRPDKVDIDTLEDRIARDCVRHDLIFKFPTLVGAWARVA